MLGRISVFGLIFFAVTSCALLAQTAPQIENERNKNRMLGPKNPSPTDKPPADPRTLTGVVRSADDEPLQGALVTLKSRKTDRVRTMVTRADGTYSFDLLRRDEDYEVSAKHRDAESPVRILSVFNTVANPRIDLKLEPKATPAASAIPPKN
jgi:hypothetical protein